MVFLTHQATVLLANKFCIDALVVTGGETVVDPEERAYLAAGKRLLQHLNAVGTQADNLARAQVAHHLVVEVGETGGLAGHGECLQELVSTDGRQAVNLLLAYHNGRASQEVASGNDAVLGQDEHRARALYLLVYQVDTFHKGVAHIDEQGHQLSLVDVVGRHLAEVHALLQQFRGYLTQVVDFGNGHHGIAPQVRIDDDGLRVGIADDANALMPLEGVEFVLEARAEIVALQRVDAAVEAAILVECHQSGAFCT